jgi:hypothetical protein
MSKFTEVQIALQIAFALKQAKLGTRVQEVCRKLAVQHCLDHDRCIAATIGALGYPCWPRQCPEISKCDAHQAISARRRPELTRAIFDVHMRGSRPPTAALAA